MKVLVGSDIGSYTFDASAKTITLIGFQPLELSQILLVTNTEAGVIIYSPFSSGKNGSISGNVLTLDYNTTLMNDADSLQIFINYDFVTDVVLADGHTNDAFGRQRMSNPHSLFENASVLNASPLVWETTTASGGTATHLPNESTVQLTVTSTIGSSVIREQHGYNRYFPGKSQLVYGTGVVGSAVSGIRKRLGYFNDQNGLFFEQGVDGINYIVLRTFVSGSAVDTKIPQSSWNLDVLDGSGSVNNPSGILFDVTKVHIFLTDFQWLGAGRVRFGTSINGLVQYVHEFTASNFLSTVYMTTGNLPVRVEITNVSSGSGGSLKQICSTVQSEGGEGTSGNIFSISNGVTTKSITTRAQLISIRLNTTVSGNVNRATIYPKSIEFMTTSANSLQFEVVLQRAHLAENNLGGAPAWNAITNSVCQYSVNGTTVTGGSVLASGYISQQTRTVSLDLSGKDFLALNSAGSTSDWLHLCAATVGGTASNCLGTITWEEKY